MFNRIRANIMITPLINILNESGSEDPCMFKNRHINGYLGYKFRSRTSDLHVNGVYEVTITKDHFGYNIAAELGYGEAIYILCISSDCKDIIGSIYILEGNIYSEGRINPKEASTLINIFKKMYDNRERTAVKHNVKKVSQKSNNTEDPIHNRYNLLKTTKSYKK